MQIYQHTHFQGSLYSSNAGDVYLLVLRHYQCSLLLLITLVFKKNKELVCSLAERPINWSSVLVIWSINIYTMNKGIKKDTHKSRWLLGNCNHTIATKRKRMFGTNFFKEYKPVNFQDTNGFLLFMPCCINNRIWIMKNLITLTHYTEMQYPIKCNFILLMTELQLSKFTSLEKALCCIHLSPAVD